MNLVNGAKLFSALSNVLSRRKALPLGFYVKNGNCSHVHTGRSLGDDDADDAPATCFSAVMKGAEALAIEQWQKCSFSSVSF